MTTQLVYNIVLVAGGVIIIAAGIYCHNRALSLAEKDQSFSYSELLV